MYSNDYHSIISTITINSTAQLNITVPQIQNKNKSMSGKRQLQKWPQYKTLIPNKLDTDTVSDIDKK